MKNELRFVWLGGAVFLFYFPDPCSLSGHNLAICGPAFFTCVPTRWARLVFCCYCWKTILKKRLGVATYFCFILKGKNKIRKKNPKYDS